ISNLEHFKINESENINLQDINTEQFLKYFNNQIVRITKVLYQNQRERNSPKLNANDFINLIKHKDPEIQEFFDILYNTINSKDKALKIQKSFKEIIIVLCYELAGLQNKQVSGVKATLDLFFTKSKALAHCINTMTNMELYTTYQIAFNKINEISDKHYDSVKKYVQNHYNSLFIAYVDDYHNLHSTHIPSTNSAKQMK
ncbi:27233_t:CDS:2, partial [Dentiscutata erythropus]